MERNKMPWIIERLEPYIFNKNYDTTRYIIRKFRYTLASL